MDCVWACRTNGCSAAKKQPLMPFLPMCILRTDEVLSLSPFADSQMPGLLSLASPGHEHEKVYGTGIQKHHPCCQQTACWALGYVRADAEPPVNSWGARVTVPSILDHRPGEKRLSHKWCGSFSLPSIAGDSPGVGVQRA